jgi:hypothetical protein
VKETVAERVARGAAALDLVYGPKWFRTENVSLADVRQGLSGMMYGFKRLFTNLGDTYESFTAKLKAKTTVPRSLMIGAGIPEIDGGKYGFYDNGGDGELAALRQEWARVIQERRYNRPARRRISAETASMVRGMKNEGVRVGA